jgi:hypothetical protein
MQSGSLFDRLGPKARSLFDHLGLNAGNTAMPTPSRALPLPQGYDPNVNQPSIGDFDGRFAQAENRNLEFVDQTREPLFRGKDNLGPGDFRPFIRDRGIYQPGIGDLYNQLFNQPPPLNTGPQIQDPETGRIFTLGQTTFDEAADTGPAYRRAVDFFNESIRSPQPINQGPPFRQPGDMSRYIAFNDPGRPGEGFSNYGEYLAAGNSPDIGDAIAGISPIGPGAHLLGPGGGQPISSGGGLSNMAFPTLAPSRPNTFTGGLFGGNNPMNNNPMNGGGMNSNQPLSQQIPQVVQQAVTPLLQNTATQLNQGIGSMVNQSLVGDGGQTGSGGGGLPAFGGTPMPSNMSNFLLGGGFNPFR